MNEQLLRQCAACPVFVHVDLRLCKTCLEAPDISFRMVEPSYSTRKVERREKVIWDFAPDRRANVDRRGVSPVEWLEAVDKFHDTQRRFR